MLLKDLASQLFAVESVYAQTMRWLPGMSTEVKVAEKRMRVLDKIRHHRDFRPEISDEPASVDGFKARVDEIASADPATEAIEIEKLIKDFLPKEVEESDPSNAAK